MERGQKSGAGRSTVDTGCAEVEGGSQEGMCTNTILSTDAFRIGDGVEACEVWVGVSCEHRWGN